MNLKPLLKLDTLMLGKLREKVNGIFLRKYYGDLFKF